MNDVLSAAGERDSDCATTLLCPILGQPTDPAPTNRCKRYSRWFGVDTSVT